MKASVAIVFLVIYLAGISSPASADGIGRILLRYPEFSNFTRLLNDSGIMKRSAGHGALTVLAVHNDQMGELLGQSMDVIDRVLSVHILLDYFPLIKINQMPEKSVRITNLWQASGETDGRQGYVNLTKFGPNQVFFRSAVKDAPFSAKLEKEVYTQVDPTRNCLHQVSNIIYTPGIEASLQPPNLTLPAPAPVTPKPKEPAQGPAEEVAAEGPSDNGVSSPTEAPSSSPAPAPAAADEEAPADDEKKNPTSFSSSAFTPSFTSAVLLVLAGIAF
ncbi:hypothetical protein NMG60_11001305 [Bertholletia excelsa]